MSAVYRVHPHPDAASLFDVLKNASIDPEPYRLLHGFSVKHVDVDPGSRSWQIHVTGPCHVGDAEGIRDTLGRLAQDLARGLSDVSSVQVVPELLGAEDPAVPAAGPVSTAESAFRPSSAFEPSPDRAFSTAPASVGSAVQAHQASPAPVAALSIAPPAQESAAAYDVGIDDEVDAYMAVILERARQWSQLQEEESKESKESGKTETVLMGRSVAEEPVPLKDVQDEERKVVIQGEVIALEVRELRSGRKLLTFDVTDRTDSITVKVWEGEGEQNLSKNLSVGDWVRLRGGTQFDPYSNELTMIPRDCVKIPPPPARMDDAKEKRVELHLHTKMSALDGAVEVGELIKLAAQWGHPAVAITDHGVVQAFPEAYAAASKAGIKLIYGVEGYLVDSPSKDSRMYHIVLLAKNRTGLVNLYKLVSLSHMKYYHRRPRIPREELEAHREGLIVGSACEAGELYQAILNGRPDDEIESIARFYDYLEIQPLANNYFLLDEGRLSSEEDLKEINRRIVRLGEKLGKPVVATGDVHFLKPEDEVFRQIIMAGHGFDVERATPLYLRTTDEMLEEFSYLGEETAYEVVVKNPRELAESVDEMRPVPDGFHPPRIAGAEEEIRKMATERAKAIYGPNLPPLVADRLERELSSIIDNGYASLYLIAHKLVDRSLKDGYLVGSRGSVGSSLVATMCRITEVNPLPPHYICPECHYFEVFDDGSVAAGVDLPHKRCPECQTPLNRDGFDIPFETFLGFYGDKVPDIDLNFSGEYQPTAHKFAEELFGSDRVYRAGTIGRLAERTAYGYVRNYLDQKGIRARNAEINRLVRGCSGVRRTTGQHPGGLMIVPEGREIYEFTPIQHPADKDSADVITTHFDCDTINDTLVKLDILGHDDPTVLRMLQELTGIDVSRVPIDDPETLKLFSGLESLKIDPKDASGEVGTLAIPEFGTRFVRQMLVETRPTTVGELVRISGLSHGTNVWTGNAQELIKAGTCTLKDVIATRDDIMTYLIRAGLEPGDAFSIMERVRKGRGLEPKHEELMKSFGVPQWYIDSCKKISYMFPKAHAAAYVMMALRIAYFKVHHPLAFYAAYFTVRASDFDADLAVAGSRRCRQEIERLEAKGNEATAKEKGTVTVLEVAVEAMARGVRFLPVDLYKSDVARFVIEDGALRCPLESLQGVGRAAALAIAEARERPFTSIEDLQSRSKVSKTVIEALRAHGSLEGLPESDQMALF